MNTTTFLVTSRSTGAACAPSVVGCDVVVEPAEATVEVAREVGGEMVSLRPCRLSEPADCAKLVEPAVSEFGGSASTPSRGA
jgi:hypothetical protein